MAGLFSISDASAMFEHLKSKWVSFYCNPTEEGLIDTLFPMYHLREWIYQGRKNEYAGKSDKELSCNEALDKRLWLLPEYGIVRSLCNHSKHYKTDPTKNTQHVTAELKGARAGLMKCNDSLGISHFTVDGQEIRDIFIAVYRVYYEYFETNGEKS
ncbi:hypothetical protein [Serratia inhibens]